LTNAISRHISGDESKRHIMAVKFAPYNWRPGTNCAILSPKILRATLTTSDLVLPASITSVCGCKYSAMDDKLLPVFATGALQAAYFTQRTHVSSKIKDLSIYRVNFLTQG
jgi:hypothetical protein